MEEPGVAEEPGVPPPLLSSDTTRNRPSHRCRFMVEGAMEGSLVPGARGGSMTPRHAGVQGRPPGEERRATGLPPAAAAGEPRHPPVCRRAGATCRPSSRHPTAHRLTPPPAPPLQLPPPPPPPPAWRCGRPPASGTPSPGRQFTTCRSTRCHQPPGHPPRPSAPPARSASCTSSGSAAACSACLAGTGTWCGPGRTGGGRCTGGEGRTRGSMTGCSTMGTPGRGATPA